MTRENLIRRYLDIFRNETPGGGGDNDNRQISEEKHQNNFGFRDKASLHQEIS